MSQTWYPVIDSEKCIECGACIDKCTHGVYDKEQAPTPAVIVPDNCVQGCHGCGNLCPAEAITYVGDTGQDSGGDCGCGGDCDGDCDCSDNNSCGSKVGTCGCGCGGKDDDCE